MNCFCKLFICSSINVSKSGFSIFFSLILFISPNVILGCKGKIIVNFIGLKFFNSIFGGMYDSSSDSLITSLVLSDNILSIASDNIVSLPY